MAEITKNLIVTVTKDQISTYEKKGTKWVPKGEFITPGMGQFVKVELSPFYCKQRLLCLLIDKQVLTYRLKDFYDEIRPLEQLFESNSPQAYHHKFGATSIGFEMEGTRMLVGDSGGRIYRWKIGNVFNVEEIVQGHNSEVIGVHGFQDGRVVSIGMDGIMKLWEKSLPENAISTVKHRTSLSCSSKLRDNSFLSGDLRGSKT